MPASSAEKIHARPLRNGIELLKASRDALQRAGLDPTLASDIEAYLAVASPGTRPGGNQ